MRKSTYYIDGGIF